MRTSIVCVALVVALALPTTWYASARASFFLIELALPAIAALIGAQLDRWVGRHALSDLRPTTRT